MSMSFDRKDPRLCLMKHIFKIMLNLYFCPDDTLILGWLEFEGRPNLTCVSHSTYHFWANEGKLSGSRKKWNAKVWCKLSRKTAFKITRPPLPQFGLNECFVAYYMILMLVEQPFRFCKMKWVLQWMPIPFQGDYKQTY